MRPRVEATPHTLSSLVAAASTGSVSFALDAGIIVNPNDGSRRGLTADEAMIIVDHELNQERSPAQIMASIAGLADPAQRELMTSALVWKLLPLGGGRHEVSGGEVRIHNATRAPRGPLTIHDSVQNLLAAGVSQAQIEAALRPVTDLELVHEVHHALARGPEACRLDLRRLATAMRSSGLLPRFEPEGIHLGARGSFDASAATQLAGALRQAGFTDAELLAAANLVVPPEHADLLRRAVGSREQASQRSVSGGTPEPGEGRALTTPSRTGYSPRR